MTISATGTCNRPERYAAAVTVARQHAGFTLLELMVVLVIIGIVFGAAMLSMRGDDVATLMQQESQRMETLINLASDEAVIRGEELALRVDQDGYEFMVLADTGWKAANDGMLKKYTMPATVELHLDVSGDSPVLAGKDEDPDRKEKQEDKAQAPQVYILSSGELTPFSVQFRSDLSRREYLLEASLLGTVKVTGEDAW
jgi:general secretion pathway protein H